ncbi:TRAP transporter small permease [Planococcus halocryophilus]|uniref:TRAP transporter small permease n=1 Tax=Planococcus halocryophilus TaxID=1215089 RepID=UPI001F0F4010|nr:TRAP transporter small permease subunit [Planococcus halocryophilus]MCH4827555.1 TRAP transporter small permease [Planococcus halocryophilus]
MNKLMNAYRVFDYFKKAGIFLSGVAMFSMIFLITADVISRNVTSKSIPGSYEIVQNYLMSLASFTIIVYAYSSGVMPRISMVVERMPYFLQKVLLLLMLAVELIIAILFVYYTLNYSITGVAEGHAFPAGGILFPIYPFLFLVPMGFMGIVIEIIFIIIKNILSKKQLWITFTKRQSSDEVMDQTYVS